MKFETHLREGTIVTFAGGTLVEEARIAFAAPYNGDWLVLADSSPFHPVSLSWPDQPGDHGTLALPGGAEYPVADTLTGFVDVDSGILFTGEDAAARSGAPAHAVVMHVVRTGNDLAAAVGGQARFGVAAPRRAALSLQHTGVHLAALALNRAAERFWTKAYPDRDGLGSANLDKAAVTGSAIETDRSLDTYRIGKSLRKKGFDRDAFLAALPEAEDEVNVQLRRFLPGVPTQVEVSPPVGRLGDRRIWSTTLEGIEVSIPCGGTHVDDLSAITAIRVDLSPTEDGFTMTTRTS